MGGILLQMLSTLPRRPQHYPSLESINKVYTMIEEFEGYVKYPPILGEEYIALAKRSIETLEKWLSSCGSIIERLQGRVESIWSNIPPIDNKEGYSKSKHEKYVSNIQDLERLYDSDNFKNAVISRIDVDRAKILIDTFNTTIAMCEYLSGKSFVNRSNDPNFKGKEDKQIEFLNRANEYFGNAQKYFPTMDGIDHEIQTTSNRIKDLISKINKKISALKATDDPNDANDFLQYKRVREKVDSCTKNDPSDIRIKKLKESLSDWENDEENRGWLKRWDFIHKCRYHSKILSEELKEEWSSINNPNIK